MSADPSEKPGSGGRSLTVLADHLRCARQEVVNLRAAVGSAQPLIAAHLSLLTALERYTAELVARRLPVPPRLRDELRLERSLGVRRSGA